MIYAGDDPVFWKEVQHIRHESIAATYIKYAALHGQERVELGVVFLQPYLDTLVPFQYGPFVEIVVVKLLAEKWRGLWLTAQLLIFVPEVAADVFGAFGITLAPGAVIGPYAGQVLYSDQSIFQQEVALGHCVGSAMYHYRKHINPELLRQEEGAFEKALHFRIGSPGAFWINNDRIALCDFFSEHIHTAFHAIGYGVVVCKPHYAAKYWWPPNPLVGKQNHLRVHGCGHEYVEEGLMVADNYRGLAEIFIVRVDVALGYIGHYVQHRPREFRQNGVIQECALCFIDWV